VNSTTAVFCTLIYDAFIFFIKHKFIMNIDRLVISRDVDIFILFFWNFSRMCALKKYFVESDGPLKSMVSCPPPPSLTLSMLAHAHVCIVGYTYLPTFFIIIRRFLYVISDDDPTTMHDKYIYLCKLLNIAILYYCVNIILLCRTRRKRNRKVINTHRWRWQPRQTIIPSRKISLANLSLRHYA
jgi:hypothetical protein